MKNLMHIHGLGIHNKNYERKQLHISDDSGSKGIAVIQKPFWSKRAVSIAARVFAPTILN